MSYDIEPEIPWYADPAEAQPTPTPAPPPVPLPPFEELPPVVLPKRPPPKPPEEEDAWLVEARRRHEARQKATPQGEYGRLEAKLLEELRAEGVPTHLPATLPRGKTALDIWQKRLDAHREERKLEALREEARGQGVDPTHKGLGWRPGDDYEALLREAIAQARSRPRRPGRNDHPWKRQVFSKGGR